MSAVSWVYKSDCCFIILRIFSLIYIFSKIFLTVWKKVDWIISHFSRFVPEYQLRYQTSFTLSWWIGKLFHRHHRTNHENLLVSVFHIPCSFFLIHYVSKVELPETQVDIIAFPTPSLCLYFDIHQKIVSLYVCRYMQVSTYEQQFAIIKKKQFI